MNNKKQPIRVPEMQLIEADDLYALLEYVAAEVPDLLTTCRWLACGPGIAPLVLGEDARRPPVTELTRLVALLETAPPEIEAAGRGLVAPYKRHLAELDVALERLIDAGAAWSHPTQVLGRPCPDFSLLLAACHDRIASEPDPLASEPDPLANEHAGPRQHLETVRRKLESAVRVEARARRRRQKPRRSRPLNPASGPNDPRP